MELLSPRTYLEIRHVHLFRSANPCIFTQCKRGRALSGILLGTESKYPASFLGGSTDFHLQTALEFEFDGGFESSDIESILAEVSRAAVTEQEAAEIPEIVSAAMEIRKANAAAAEQRRLDQQQAKTQTDSGPAAPINGPNHDSAHIDWSVSQLSTAQDGSAQSRTDGVTRISGETYQEISCNAATWEGVVENIGDLFECDKVRAIQSLSQGRLIKITVKNPQFSSGSFYVTTSRYPSYSIRRFSIASKTRRGK